MYYRTKTHAVLLFPDIYRLSYPALDDDQFSMLKESSSIVWYYSERTTASDGGQGLNHPESVFVCGHVHKAVERAEESAVATTNDAPCLSGVFLVFFPSRRE